jgi:DNA polymerase I-like protein with 3'-5' exonuclease and polymerase domains
MQEVVNNSKLVMPTGREYVFKKEQGKDWPRTQILNYPVQGLGADLLSIIRVSLYKRMKKQKLVSELICTVHDSILIDCYDEEVKSINDIIVQVFKDLPKNFQRVFGKEFNLPLTGETTVGDNWGSMISYEEYLENAN